MIRSRQIISTIAAKARTHDRVASPLKQNKFKETCSKPLNDTQRHYINILKQEDPVIVIAHGAAGSGKTYCATSVALDMINQGRVSRIVLTRPAICVDDEEHGFLPGTLEAKLGPWMLPIFDVLNDKIGKGHVERMIKEGKIEIAPLSHMRGRTFNDAWIILDEAQNTTIGQMKMVLTRIGQGSKLVITGDPSQNDRVDENGLSDLLDRLLELSEYDQDDIRIVEFTERDVERHPVVPFVLSLYS